MLKVHKTNLSNPAHYVEIVHFFVSSQYNVYVNGF